MDMRSTLTTLFLPLLACDGSPSPAPLTVEGAPATNPAILPARTNGPEPPAPADAPWTGWGEWVQGIRVRARFPTRVLRGDEIRAPLQFEFDAGSADPGITLYDANDVEVRCWLVADDAATHRRVAVAPYDCHLPSPDDPRARFALAGPPPPPIEPRYHLSMVWDELPAGLYTARLEVRLPPSSSWHDPADPERVAIWSGIVSTAPFGVTVDDAPLERIHFRVPTRLTLQRIPGSPGILVVCTFDDKRPVDFDVHHGFSIGFESESSRGSTLRGGPPTPDASDDHLDFIRADETGPFQLVYTMKVFESPDPPCHMWHPHPSDPHYRVLWSSTLTLYATAEEIAALRR
jgi:hypothetical protein